MKKKVIFIIFILIVITSCSRKNHGVVTRTYHRVTSWYNTIFNGSEALKQELKTRTDSYKDNYSSTLQVEPIEYVKKEVEPKDNPESIFTLNKPTPAEKTSETSTENETKKATGLDRSIEKAIKAIENHSISIKGKEYNSMMGEAYLLLGRAKLYKGKVLDAVEVFNYMNKTLVKSPKINQSKIYLAEAQSFAGNNFDAEELFMQMAEDKTFKKRDKKLMTKKYAQYLINKNKNKEAIDVLDIAYRYNKNNTDRSRFAYIQAQLYEQLNDKTLAIQKYNLAYKKASDFNMEVKSKIAIAKLFDPQTNNFIEEEKKLLKLVNKGTYKSLKNELYYGLGILSQKVDSTDKAQKYFKLSLKEKSSDPQVRGLVYLTMADRFFKKSDYLYAGAYYDSASANIQDEKTRESIMNKVEKIKDLSKNYYIVKKNDSILSLLNKPIEARKEFFTKYIEKLKEKEAKQKAKEEAEKENSFLTETNTLTSSFNESFGNKGSFYFYSTSLKSKGEQEFKTLWKNRSLTDGWRLGNAGAGAGNNSIDQLKQELLGQKDAKNPRRFEPDFYLEKLPKTETAKDSLKIERDNAELKLGLDYYDYFKDKKLAMETLEHLVNTPPKNQDVKTTAYYNLYRIGKDNNDATTDKYKEALIKEAPDSKYAKYILNPKEANISSKSKEATNLYKQIQDAFFKGDITNTKKLITDITTLYPTDELIPKVELINAMILGKENKLEDYKTALDKIMGKYEGTPEAEKAEKLLNALKEIETKKATETISNNIKTDNNK